MKKLKYPKLKTYSEVIDLLNEKNKEYKLEEIDGYQCIRAGRFLFKYNKEGLLKERIERQSSVGYGYEFDYQAVSAYQYDEQSRISRSETHIVSDVISDGEHKQEKESFVCNYKYYDDGFSKEETKTHEEKVNGEEGCFVSGSKIYTCDNEGNVIKEFDIKPSVVQIPGRDR